MGYALIMFGVLLVMSVVMVTAVNYGIAKDSQVAPLRAENIYAEREMGKAQTELTINNTCLDGGGGYTGGNGINYVLWLTVKNNGSTVLNPNNLTLFYNLSYYTFSATTDVDSAVPFGNVLSPLINSTIKVSNIIIDVPDANYPLRLMLAASNGVKAIAPTAPNNFTGRSDDANTSYSFSWNPSTDDTGIGYYILYAFPNSPDSCPQQDYYRTFTIIPGNSTSSGMSKSLACEGNCPHTYFYLTAVDLDGNMGIQSVTLDCNPPQTGQPCNRKI